MSRNYKKTHIKILNSAKNNFLDYGYERTNLRKICKDADVTTGAFYKHFHNKATLFESLVSPALKEIKNMYIESENEYFDLINSDELYRAWQLSPETVKQYVKLIYAHYDAFKLLLTCSDGTVFSSFVDDMVNIEVKETIKFLNEAKKRGITINELNEKELHILIHSYLSSLFEIVIHDYILEDALRYANTLVKFFNAGWQAVLGF
ncbi:TetR/AcrR family transcriptional regulator [Clostridiaceae bacterium M8S5]|nr:TetR/AcrR family transcriptional regulator [Clostridiaceae bacterium M8S5]